MVHAAAREGVALKLLIVDDDRELVDLLSFTGTRAGFETVAAYDGETAVSLTEHERPDLVVLDVNLSEANGFDVLARVRRTGRLPVILLSARSSEDDKVRGLELGADDYMTKPFSHRELMARVHAVLRRTGQEPTAPARTSTVLRAGPITLNIEEHAAFRNGEPLNLTVIEFRLLHYVMSNANVVVSTPVLLKHVWGYDDFAATDIVRVTIFRLRRKIEDDPSEPRLLQTVAKVGFIFRPGPEEPAAEIAPLTDATQSPAALP